MISQWPNNHCFSCSSLKLKSTDLVTHCVKVTHRYFANNLRVCCNRNASFSYETFTGVVI